MNHHPLARFVGSIALLTLCAIPLHAAEPGDIEKLEQRRFDALTQNDLDTLGKLLADDLIYTHSSAKIDSKETYIGSLKSGDVRYIDVKRTDTRIKVYGTSAVVSGSAQVKAALKGNEINVNIRYTDVWVERAGAWQMVAWEATPIPAK